MGVFFLEGNEFQTPTIFEDTLTCNIQFSVH